MKPRRATLAAGLAAALLLPGCTHFGVEDCPEGQGRFDFSVLGQDVARVRSSHYRLALANLDRAAARFVPYALMSAYAYFDAPGCANAGKALADSPAAETMRARLREPAADGASFERRPELEQLGGCEDALGMMYHVWWSAQRNELVIAFRGTSGAGDWWYGNFWALSRFLSKTNQYAQAREHAQGILAKLGTAPFAAGAKPRIVVTGHSLGGGLAQHVLYSFPQQVAQAVVFDPSIVTGYTGVAGAQRVAECNCGDQALGAEAPILRVYESYEILASLRIFHKTFFPPHLHIQEVRFPYHHSWNAIGAHSMANLADSLHRSAGRERARSAAPWYASADKMCTERFEQAQRTGCESSGKAAICSTSPQPRGGTAQ